MYEIPNEHSPFKHTYTKGQRGRSSLFILKGITTRGCKYVMNTNLTKEEYSMQVSTQKTIRLLSVLNQSRDILNLFIILKFFSEI